MIGKTGTAEILFNPNMNPSSKAQMYKHTWFGAISFAPDPADKVSHSRPELVIVVFSRYGEAGKEGAPIAAQLIHKWREIQGRKVNIPACF
jgi:cell division protein FtsI/penicillin-binding protein 2